MKTTSEVFVRDSSSAAMINDYVALEYEEENEVEEEVPLKVTVNGEKLRYKQSETTLDKQLEMVESTMSKANSNGITINIYNNQIYNQNANDEARVVNNHGQDITLGDKL